MAEKEIRIQFLNEGPRREEWFAGEGVVIDPGSTTLRAGARISIAGEARMQRGCEYRISGQPALFRGKQQFKFSHCVESEPMQETGVIAYLAQQGKGCGIGPALARRIFDELGSDCLQAIRENPMILCDLFRTISEEGAQELSERLRSNHDAEQTYVELQSLFANRGFPKKTVKAVIGDYGAESLTVIRRNPFALLKYDGVGFKLCDKLFCDLNQGKRPERRLRRIAHLLAYLMQQDRSGSTWHDARQIVRLAIDGSGADLERIKQAVRFGRRVGIIETQRIEGDTLTDDGGELFLAIARHAADEKTVAARYCELCEEQAERVGEFGRQVVTTLHESKSRTQCTRCGRLLTSDEIHVLDGEPYGPTCIGYIEGGEAAEIVHQQDWAKSHAEYRTIVRSVRIGSREITTPNLWPEQIRGLSDHQAETWLEATANRVGMLLGCGGTGKSYTVAKAIETLTVPLSDIAVAAPTGKAAVRLSELLAGHGIQKRAHTLHKLLGYTGEGFAYHRRNQWPFRILIIDEFSMVPISLLRSVLDATAYGTHVLFVGDVQQLAPVGHGAPLRDFIAAGVSHGELTEIQRNAGGIVEVCHAIRNSADWEPHDNLTLGDCGADGMIRSLHELGRDCDPIWDVQAIVGSNDKGELSREILNKALQAELNPKGESHRDWQFKVGDKIVNRKNGWFRALDASEDEMNSRGEVYAANGELARVTDLSEKYFDCELSAPERLIRVYKGGNSFELGYALTAHSCQGAEWPKVVVGIDSKLASSPIFDRSWLYTAISRARTHCHIVGEKSQADAMCRIQRTQNRKTFLRQRILLQQAASILMEV